MPRIKGAGWKSGDIKIHTGTLETIPSGWQLCDGTNGTPPMVDRAVVGAGHSYSQGQKFGADSRTPNVSVQNHTLSNGQGPSHTHNTNRARTDYGSSTAGGWFRDTYRFALAPEGIGNIYYITNSSGVHNSGGSGAHNHGATSDSVDTRQQSIAVYWIMKL